MKPDPVRQEREEAWIGDAVLALYARSWILREKGRMDAELFTRMTSNSFLATIGNPTGLEARIGQAYARGGLEEGFRFIETEIMPIFLRRRDQRKG